MPGSVTWAVKPEGRRQHRVAEETVSETDVNPRLRLAALPILKALERRSTGQGPAYVPEARIELA